MGRHARAARLKNEGASGDQRVGVHVRSRWQQQYIRQNLIQPHLCSTAGLAASQVAQRIRDCGAQRVHAHAAWLSGCSSL